jgi:uncharacterized protein (TIGR02453 family)
MDKVVFFQKKIRKNNNRDWFHAHKEEYEASNEQLKSFTLKLVQEMSKHDHIDESGTKIFRIYRDVRFANDKTPYTLHRSFTMKRATEALRGGYYVKIQPGDSYIIGGFFGPNAKDLLHIRKQIQQDPDSFRKILSSKKIKSSFGEMIGEQVKTTPRGFLKDDPAIDLLRYKRFMFKQDFTDQQVLQKDFVHKLSNGFRNMRPFLDYMSDILTTDLNGRSLLD